MLKKQLTELTNTTELYLVYLNKVSFYTAFCYNKHDLC